MSTGELLDDRYRLGGLIGTGGMADVHRATDTRLNREVALKIFRPHGDRATAARLESEARLLAGLSHPGLVRVFDVALDGDQPYLVMQLVTGCTLRTLLDSGPLGGDVVARLGLRLANTLAYVHSQGIVHRDMKPSNVLLDEEGTCYLADFGIARALGTARLTSTGHCVGTAAYLAPEQVRGDETGPAGDIYSLGLVLLECLTGEPAYDGTDVEAAIARLSRAPEIPEWLPEVWADTVAAMTAREPVDRPDAADCAQRLAAAALVGKMAPPPLRPPWERDRRAQATTYLPAAAPPPEPRPRKRFVHSWLAVTAVLAGGLIAIAATRDSTAGPAAPVVTPAPTSTVAVPPMNSATQVIQAPEVTVAPAPGNAQEKPRGKPAKEKQRGKSGDDD
ncbi:serine/threonine-protein kinase [Actinokineospora sp.]|uniref:serine/threonine-protein kinase n=1 Tax=Actinokineospora sp. TaxID=1872133 RepID=UPI004038389C